jgi:hypothetical protein
MGQLTYYHSSKQRLEEGVIFSQELEDFLV